MTWVCLAIIRGAAHYDPTPKPLALRIAFGIILVVAVVSLLVKSIREDAARNLRRKRKKAQQKESRRKGSSRVN